MLFGQLPPTKAPDCSVWGTQRPVPALINYEGFCGGGAGGGGTGDGVEIAAAELKREWIANPKLLLLDVREPHEYEIARIEGARLMPLSELPGRLRELDGRAEIVTH